MNSDGNKTPSAEHNISGSADLQRPKSTSRSVSKESEPEFDDPKTGNPPLEDPIFDGQLSDIKDPSQQNSSKKNSSQTQEKNPSHNEQSDHYDEHTSPGKSDLLSKNIKNSGKQNKFKVSKMPESEDTLPNDDFGD